MIRCVQIFLIIFIIYSFGSCNKKASPEHIDLSSYQLIDTSLQLTVIASEPTITTPVAIDFDTHGRLWVAEMPDYMPDINGEKENIPVGRIVILEDTNHDGYMDKSTVFKDSIHQLRALKLYNNGVLFADDPNLYFADIKNDKPSNITIIDSFYSVAGNVEHKANGLLLNIDNCIYNAKSYYRYCFDGWTWSKEPTNFRGQWGITNDENGRLYANDNSNFFIGDQFLSNTLISNQYIHKPQGLNKDLVHDRTMFPRHATAINRGYIEGMLDKNGRVISTTSACGPHIFQSKSLGDQYFQNAFICAPEGNLIKRLKVETNEFLPTATFADENQEFLSSTDEGFRPVNINTGPDGNLYIVDMHRGIIQHKIYMTNYLKERILEKELDKIVGYGRIIKISQKHAQIKEVNYDFEQEDSLLSYIGKDNDWLRSKAQEILRFYDSKTLEDKLYAKLLNGNKLDKLHALWILAGRKNIDLKKIVEIQFQDQWIIANLFKIIGQKNIDIDKKEIVKLYDQYKNMEDPIVINHMLTSLSILYDSHPELHSYYIKELKNGMDDAYIASYPSGVLVKEVNDRSKAYNAKVEKSEPYYIFKKQDRPSKTQNGYTLFNTYCSSCHGFGGEGMEGQAPSLVGGKLINDQPQLIPLIIQNGLTGPVTIDGKVETFPSVMPSFNLSVNEIEKISNYIYNAFTSEVKSVNKEMLDSLKGKFSDRSEMWTEEELLNTEF